MKDWKVMMSTGWSSRIMYDGLSLEEAEEICESYGYAYVDENGFEWSLSIG